MDCFGRREEADRRAIALCHGSKHAPFGPARPNTYDTLDIDRYTRPDYVADLSAPDFMDVLLSQGFAKKYDLAVAVHAPCHLFVDTSVGVDGADTYTAIKQTFANVAAMLHPGGLFVLTTGIYTLPCVVFTDPETELPVYCPDVGETRRLLKCPEFELLPTAVSVHPEKQFTFRADVKVLGHLVPEVPEGCYDLSSAKSSSAYHTAYAAHFEHARQVLGVDVEAYFCQENHQVFAMRKL